MNLYRSFGNLLETWVSEGGPALVFPDSAGKWPDTDSGVSFTLSESELPSKPQPHTPVRSESRDSGMELVSPVSPLPSPHYPGADTDTNADLAGAGGGEEVISSSLSPPRSPILPLSSSSSSSLLLDLSEARAPLGTPEHSVAMHLKLEQTLQRTNTGRNLCRQRDSQLLGDQAPRKRCDTAYLSTQSSHGLTTGQRSGSLDPRRIEGPAVGRLQDRHRRSQSLYQDRLPVQTEGEIHMGLSPGLGYLEQLCRMLEEMAKLQLENQRLQMEMESVRALQSLSQITESHRRDSKGSEGNEQWPKHTTNDISIRPLCQNDVFRRRSMSDALSLSQQRQRSFDMNTRGQCLNSDALLEQEDDETEKTKTNTETMDKYRKMKIKLLKREGSKHSFSKEKNSSQTNSSIKNRVGDLFRRSKPTPVLTDRNVPEQHR